MPLDLWIDKYKPESLDGFVGQKKTVDFVNNWLNSWKPKKALLFCGKTGIGKSLLVELLAKERGWLVVRLSANEVRNTEEIEKIISTSKDRTLFFKGKVILIDELEGISGRDRGAMKAIGKLVTESKFPVFLVCEDPYLPKLRSLKEKSEIVKFDKIPVPSIAKFLGDICNKEGVEVEKDTLKILAKFAQGDLRSAITDLQIVCLGKNKLENKDLEALGFREREQAIFNSLHTIFHSRSLNASKKAIQDSDKDMDEIFWWVENNILKEFKTKEELVQVFGLLSSADMLRSKVSKQQNWRFKFIASNLISGISLFKESHTGFVMYRPPDRFLQLGRTKAKRAAMKAIFNKIGEKTHCSGKVVNSQLPYLKIILKNNKDIGEQLDLEKDELKMLS